MLINAFCCDKKKLHITPARILIFIALFIILSTTTSLLLSSKCLCVTKFAISSSDVTSDIRIVQLSDLHNSTFGEDNVRLVEKVKDQQPDIILLTGDMVNSYEEDVQIAVSLVEQLVLIAPVYFSNGNHELDYEEKWGGDLTTIFEDAGAVVLEEEYVDVKVKGQEIRIGGFYGYCLPDSFEGTEGFDEAEYHFMCTFYDTDNYKILLSHLPTSWIDYGFAKMWQIDSIFTGHYHGGQVRFPIIGGLYAPDLGWFPGKVAGMYPSGNTRIFLSRGLGTTAGRPRFNNVPEIVVVDVVPGDIK